MDKLIHNLDIIITNIMDDPKPFLFYVTLLVILIILILREIRCWYWKINERIELQNNELNALLQIIDRQDEEIGLLRSINSKLNSEESLKNNCTEKPDFPTALDEAATTTESNKEQ